MWPVLSPCECRIASLIRLMKGLIVCFPLGIGRFAFILGANNSSVEADLMLKMSVEKGTVGLRLRCIGLILWTKEADWKSVK